MEIIEAMGAKAIDKKDPKRKQKIEAMFLSKEFAGQRKLDGERLMAFKDEDGETVRLFGRGKSKSNERMEKTDLLPQIVSQLQFVPSGTILDGEIIYIDPMVAERSIQYGNWDFKESFWDCRRIMGSHADEAIAKQENEGWPLFYVVFDMISLQGDSYLNTEYRLRHSDLCQVVGLTIENLSDQHVFILPFYYGIEAKRRLFEESMALGLEGILLKNLNGTYHPGKKPTNEWVKVKREDDADCVVMGYSPANRFTEITRDGMKVLGPDGEPQVEESRFYKNGWIGAVWIGQYIEAERVTKEQERIMTAMQDLGVCWSGALNLDGKHYVLRPVAKVSGMTDDLRKHISEHKEDYLGKVMRITYFDKTKDMSFFQPRFENFRDDKPTNECIWED